MAKSNLSELKPQTPQNPEAERPLFFLRSPAERVLDLDPNLNHHLELAARHLEKRIANLLAVQDLAGIDGENNCVKAMAFGLAAAMEKIEEVHRHFVEIINLIESKPAEQKALGSAARRSA